MTYSLHFELLLDIIIDDDIIIIDCCVFVIFYTFKTMVPTTLWMDRRSHVYSYVRSCRCFASQL